MLKLRNKESVAVFLSIAFFANLLFISCVRSDGNSDKEPNEIKSSELLSIHERNGYEEVRITNPKGETVALYILLEKDKKQPEKLPKGAEILRVPLNSVILDSEVYAGALEELNSDTSIKGMFDVNFVTSPQLQERIEKGLITDMGSTASPNIEKIISSDPEAIFLSYFEGMQTQAVDKTGTPIIKMYDLQESTPLGRAEWIRFIGRLFGKKQVADSLFNAVSTSYLASVTTVNDKLKDKKKVLTETMYEGVWNVAGGKSYQANLIKDAGGRYFKEKDNSNVTLMLTPEQVLKDGADSDVWIIRHYGGEDELKKILNSDPVYKEIKAFKNGNIYFSDTSVSGLFREFPFHPDLLLKDYEAMVAENDPATNMKYFKKLNL